MTQQQYEELCKILGKRPTDKELKEMYFSPVDGEFDEAVDCDIGMYKFEEYKRNLWEKKEQ